MRGIFARAASATLLGVGVAALWGAVGLFALAILHGGITAGFGAGNEAFLIWLREGVMALASGLAILAARKRPGPRFLALGLAGDLGLMVVAVTLPGVAALRWVAIAFGALGVVGFLASAALVVSGGARPSATA